MRRCDWLEMLRELGTKGSKADLKDGVNVRRLRSGRDGHLGETFNYFQQHIGNTGPYAQDFLIQEETPSMPRAVIALHNYFQRAVKAIVGTQTTRTRSSPAAAQKFLRENPETYRITLNFFSLRRILMLQCVVVSTYLHTVAQQRGLLRLGLEVSFDVMASPIKIGKSLQ